LGRKGCGGRERGIKEGEKMRWWEDERGWRDEWAIRGGEREEDETTRSEEEVDRRWERMGWWKRDERVIRGGERGLWDNGKWWGRRSEVGEEGSDGSVMRGW
jgi:hypothetical protein